MAALQWQKLRQGFNNSVYKIIKSPDGDIYACGLFTLADGQPALRIARWDGINWHPVGDGFDNAVNDIAFDSTGKLYAIGTFTGSISAWDGVAWSVVGGGLNAAGIALLIDSDDSVYVGGLFTLAGGVAVSKVAKWSGTEWLPVGDGLARNISSLTKDSNGFLYAGGIFVSGTGGGLFKLVDNEWAQMAPNINGTINGLSADGDGNIYACGGFTQIDGSTYNRVAMLSSLGVWSALGTGLDFTCLNVYYVVDRVFAVGFFANAGGNPASRIAQYLSGAWSAVSAGVLNTYARDIVVVEHTAPVFFVAGDFFTIDGDSFNYIAELNVAATLTTNPVDTIDFGTSDLISSPELLEITVSGAIPQIEVTAPDNIEVSTDSLLWANQVVFSDVEDETVNCYVRINAEKALDSFGDIVVSNPKFEDIDIGVLGLTLFGVYDIDPNPTIGSAFEFPVSGTFKTNFFMAGDGLTTRVANIAILSGDYNLEFKFAGGDWQKALFPTSWNADTLPLGEQIEDVEFRWRTTTAGVYSIPVEFAFIETAGTAVDVKEGVDFSTWSKVVVNFDLIIQADSGVFRLIKMNEGYKDFLKKQGSSSSVLLYKKEEWMVGFTWVPFYYNPLTAQFSTTGSGDTYRAYPVPYDPQDGGTEFNSYFTTCNLVFEESPYVFANNRFFIHTATSLGKVKISAYKGGRYSDTPEASFIMHQVDSETAEWSEETTQAYRYNKQLFIKEITAITTQDQSVKFKVVATLTDGNDEIAINSIKIRAGEIIFNSGGNI